MSTIHTWARDNYTISTDPALLDLDVIHDYLHHSYWSPGVPRDVVEKAIEHSLCFGLYADEQDGRSQFGFARVVTDQATFAYLADVFVLEAYCSAGLGVWLVNCIIHCPALDGLRTFLLATKDAQRLYEKFGFEAVTDSGRMMALKRQMPWYRPELVRDP